MKKNFLCNYKYRVGNIKIWYEYIKSVKKYKIDRSKEEKW